MIFISLSEFRYNRKRKHYSYLFKSIGSFRLNIIFSTKPVRRHNNRVLKNVSLYKHPNENSDKSIYAIPIIHLDHVSFFDRKLNWHFDRNDKRKIKRIIKHKKV